MRRVRPLWFLYFLFTSLLWSAMASAIAVAGLTIDADRQYDYAQSRFEAGAFDEAIIEFNRFVYFFPEDPRVEQATVEIGRAHFNAGRYAEAAAVFDRLIGRATTDATLANAYLLLSRSHAAQGLFERAKLDLRNLITVSGNPDIIDRARYELGWLLIDQGRWDEADSVFRQISADNHLRYRVEALRRDLSKADQIRFKDPTTAGLFSLVPGLGQVYLGRYRDALTAFLINAGLIWAAWEAFDNDLYALGGVITFVEFGFYAGNIYGAVSGAHKYNRERNAAFGDQLTRDNRLRLAAGHTSRGLFVGLKMSF